MSTPSKTAYYIGFDTCGCAVAVSVDSPANKREELADDVAQMIRNGYTVQRMDDMPTLVWDCAHKPISEPCAACGGTGRIHDGYCCWCHGTGKAAERASAGRSDSTPDTAPKF